MNIIISPLNLLIPKYLKISQAYLQAIRNDSVMMFFSFFPLA